MFDDERYHEVHIKLSLPDGRYDELYAWLVDAAPAVGWVPSRNPFERRAGEVVQLVTLRCYEGDRAAADRRVDEALASLAARGVDVVEVKRETTVLDTHPRHDRWWSGP